MIKYLTFPFDEKIHEIIELFCVRNYLIKENIKEILYGYNEGTL